MRKGTKFLSVMLSLVIVCSIFSTTFIHSKAIDSNYELSEDGYYLDVYGNFDQLEVPDSVEELFIHDADVNYPLTLDNGRMSHITFRNCIISTSDIGEFDNLTAITMIGCRVKDLNFLTSNPKIDFLDIDSCYLESLDGIQKLTELTCLNFYDVGIESIEIIRNHKKIEQLVLSNTCVKDLSPIENMKIKDLDISNTLTIRDLTPIKTLKKLDSFICLNCEMAVTQDVYDFINRNRINSNLNREWKNIQKSVNKIASNIFSERMTSEEKIEATVKYVLNHMEYDFNVENDRDLSLEYNEYALSYALKGEGACRNYTALTTVLLQEAGIDVYEIKGDNHIWNLINLDNKYYWLDVTWLDNLSWEEIQESNYYMNDSFLFIDHEPLTIPLAMFKANSTFPTDIEEGITEEPTIELPTESEEFTSTEVETETSENTPSETEESAVTEEESSSEQNDLTEDETEEQESTEISEDETKNDNRIVIIVFVIITATIIFSIIIYKKRKSK